MKKLFLIVVILLFSLPVFAFYNKKNEFKYLENGVYIKKGSIYYKDNFWFGTFKIENKEGFKILKLKASCDNDETLVILGFFEYDKNSNLISTEDDKHPSCHYPALVNGEIYYNAICKIKNKK